MRNTKIQFSSEKIDQLSDVIITGDGTPQSPLTTLDLSDSIGKITMVAPLVVTSVINVPKGFTWREYVHGGSVFSLTILGFSDFTSKNNSYFVKIYNDGITTTIFDGVGEGSSILATTPLIVESTDVLLMNATPQTVKDSPGAGLIDRVELWIDVDYKGTPYATNTIVEVLSGTEVIGELDVLGVTASGRYKIPITGVPQENGALTVRTKTGEATAGNSNIGFVAFYETVSAPVFAYPTYIWNNEFDTWDLTNPDSANLVVTRTGTSMLFEHNGAETTALSSNFNQHPTPITATKVVYRFTIASTGDHATVAKGVVMRNADGTRVAMVINDVVNNLGQILLRTTIDGSTTDTYDTGVINGEYLVEIESTQVIFKRWNGTSWDVSATHIRSFGSHAWYFRGACSNTTTKVGAVEITEAYGLTETFTTRLPA